MQRHTWYRPIVGEAKVLAHANAFLLRPRMLAFDHFVVCAREALRIGYLRTVPIAWVPRFQALQLLSIGPVWFPLVTWSKGWAFRDLLWLFKRQHLFFRSNLSRKGTLLRKTRIVGCSVKGKGWRSGLAGEVIMLRGEPLCWHDPLSPFDLNFNVQLSHLSLSIAFLHLTGEVGNSNRKHEARTRNAGKLSHNLPSAWCKTA
jgi:hypothetical protein